MSGIRISDNGYGFPQLRQQSWYDEYECTCCPYGYHIDLDFVRYCESVSDEAKNRKSSTNRYKNRRRRQSMEVMLGIMASQPGQQIIGTKLKAIDGADEQQEVSTKIIQKLPVMRDQENVADAGFDDAVSDFEKTLQRSKNKLYNNLPDVTAVSVKCTTTAPSPEEPSRIIILGGGATSSSMSSTVQPNLHSHNHHYHHHHQQQHDVGAGMDTFDTASIGSGSSGANQLDPLHTIREQMALSLERTKWLEEQVKLIPKLKNEISDLIEENDRLSNQLRIQRDIRVNRIQHETSHTTNTDGSLLVRSEPLRKDIGITCSVLTRNIGVGEQRPSTKSASTNTSTISLGDLSQYADKWYTKKLELMDNEQRAMGDSSRRARSTQTLATTTQDVDQQTTQPLRVHVGVQHQSLDEGISLRSISLPTTPIATRNWLTETLSPPEQRSVASQCFGRPSTYQHKASQSEMLMTKTRGSQHTVLQADKETQSGRPRTVKTIACGNDNSTAYAATKEIAINTDASNTIAGDPTCERCDGPSCKGAVKKEGSGSPSRIPRLMHPVPHAHHATVPGSSRAPMSPEPGKKLHRQDTYTKISVDRTPSERLSLSGLDLSIPQSLLPPQPIIVPSVLLDSQVEELGASAAGTLSLADLPRIKKSSSKRHSAVTYTVESVPGISSSSSDGDAEVNPLSCMPSSTSNVSHVTDISHVSDPPSNVSDVSNVSNVTIASNLTTILSGTRDRVIPTPEMRGAMKVMNDSLKKTRSKNFSLPRTSTAVGIIQKEWFRISSTVHANPLVVEDYLDAFEEMSSTLLEYIVNIPDDTGNTAMHYAISYSNFDIVSILLDSKVCDIDQPNRAGYTAVMLVSLAESSSTTDNNVIKRLFQMADVNIRAHQNGQTALMLAVSHGRLDTVKMLVEAGADINIQDADGSTALMCAAEHGHQEIVKYFISQTDCDSSIFDVDGSTALRIAMEAGHRHVGVLLYAHERNYPLYSSQTKLKKPTSALTTAIAGTSTAVAGPSSSSNALMGASSTMVEENTSASITDANTAAMPEANKPETSLIPAVESDSNSESSVSSQPLTSPLPLPKTPRALNDTKPKE